MRAVAEVAERFRRLADEGQLLARGLAHAQADVRAEGRGAVGQRLDLLAGKRRVELAEDDHALAGSLREQRIVLVVELLETLPELLQAHLGLVEGVVVHQAEHAAQPQLAVDAVADDVEAHLVEGLLDPRLPRGLQGGFLLVGLLLPFVLFRVVLFRVAVRFAVLLLTVVGAGVLLVDLSGRLLAQTGLGLILELEQPVLEPVPLLLVVVLRPVGERVLALVLLLGVLGPGLEEHLLEPAAGSPR